MYYILDYNKVHQSKEHIKKIIRRREHIYSIYWGGDHVQVDGCS